MNFKFLSGRDDPSEGHKEHEKVVGNFDYEENPIDTQRDCFPLKLGVKGKRNVAV